MEVPVTQLRTHLKDWLARARGGEEIVITERGVPIARLSGVGTADHLARLTAAGIIGEAERPKVSLSELPPGPKLDFDLAEFIER